MTLYSKGWVNNKFTFLAWSFFR